MASLIDEVFKFISDHKDFRPTLGVVSSNHYAKTLVTIGAIHRKTNERWVPGLYKAKAQWPDAQWTPITEEQAELFDAAYKEEFNAARI